MVKAYSVSTWAIVLVHLVASGFLLYFAYSGKTVFKGCQVNGNDCAFHFRTWQKVVYTIIVVVISLIHVCAYNCVVLLQYV